MSREAMVLGAVLLAAIFWNRIETLVALACIIAAIYAFADANEQPRSKPTRAEPDPVAACGVFVALEDLDYEPPCEAAP